MMNFFNLTAYENLTKDQIDEIVSTSIVYDNIRRCGNGNEYYICNDLVACWTRTGFDSYTLWF